VTENFHVKNLVAPQGRKTRQTKKNAKERLINEEQSVIRNKGTKRSPEQRDEMPRLLQD